MATIGLTIFVGRTFVRKASSIVYSIMIRVSWVGCPYFKRPIFFLFGIQILPVVNVPLGVFSIVASLGYSVLRWMVPLFRSNVDDRYVGRYVTDVYRLDFLIGTILNKVALLSTL